MSAVEQQTPAKVIELREARQEGWFPASLSDQRVYDAVRQGLIPAVKIGRRIYFSPDQLSRWLEQGGTALSGGWRRAEG